MSRRGRSPTRPGCAGAGDERARWIPPSVWCPQWPMRRVESGAHHGEHPSGSGVHRVGVESIAMSITWSGLHSGGVHPVVTMSCTPGRRTSAHRGALLAPAIAPWWARGGDGARPQ